MDDASALDDAGAPQAPAPNAVWATLAAFCASLVGIGLARFAYTPLLPALVGAHWFEAAAAAYLGAANLAGYLAGALAGRPFAARVRVAPALRAMMLLATVAFLACAFPVSFAWFFGWRFLAGLAGGALMVLAAPAVLPHVPVRRRGLAGGVIFMGVGVGIAASGTLVPLLLQDGLRDTWLALAGLSLLLTAIAWKGWPSRPAPAAAVPVARHPVRANDTTLRALYVEYALNAAGWVPHMIFLVDFVARGLGEGVATGSHYWVLFGIGATAGPIVVGYLADRIGFKRALRLAFALQTIGVVIPALHPAPAWLIVSSVVVGAFVTGTVPLVLGRVHELLAHQPTRRDPAWRTATVAFALFQAMAAYGLSYVFAQSGANCRLLFFAGTAAMVCAFVIDLLAGARERVRPAGATAP
jgi:predicted MFS family arabinose efflux permease